MVSMVEHEEYLIWRKFIKGTRATLFATCVHPNRTIRLEEKEGNCAGLLYYYFREISCLPDEDEGAYVRIKNICA